MIFLSFSAMDRQFADRIEAELKNIGFDVWYSPRRLNPGDNYAAEIPKAIRNSSCLVLLHSGNANASPHILRELELALAQRKPIYPLRISRETPADAMEYYLSGVQWQNLCDDYAEGIRHFITFLSTEHRSGPRLSPGTAQASLPQPVNSGQEDEFRIIHCADETRIADLLRDAIAIDSQSYREDFVGIFDRCIDWYRANPDIYTFATDLEGRTIGYVNAMPIEEETYNLMLHGDFLDNDISPEAIVQLTFPGEFFLYFCSIGVDRRYKNSRLFRILFDAFIAKMNRWYDDGFIAKRIISDAVTRDGTKMCDLIGCKKQQSTTHCSCIYTLSMLPPEIKPTTTGVKELIRKYMDYYKSTLRT